MNFSSLESTIYGRARARRTVPACFAKATTGGSRWRTRFVCYNMRTAHVGRLTQR